MMILVDKMKFKPVPTVNRIAGNPGQRKGVVYSKNGMIEVSERRVSLVDHDWLYISFHAVINIGGTTYCRFDTFKTGKFYTNKGLAQLATKWLNSLYFE